MTSLDFAGTCQRRLYAAEDRAHAGAHGARMGASTAGSLATLSAFALAAASAVRDGPHDLPSAATVAIVCVWAALALWAAATLAVGRRDARTAS